MLIQTMYLLMEVFEKNLQISPLYRFIVKQCEIDGKPGNPGQKTASVKTFTQHFCSSGAPLFLIDLLKDPPKIEKDYLWGTRFQTHSPPRDTPTQKFDCRLKFTFSVISEEHLYHLLYLWLIVHFAIWKRVRFAQKIICLSRAGTIYRAILVGKRF